MQSGNIKQLTVLPAGFPLQAKPRGHPAGEHEIQNTQCAVGEAGTLNFKLMSILRQPNFWFCDREDVLTTASLHSSLMTHSIPGLPGGLAVE